MSLKEYKKKRDFKKTSEPEGKVERGKDNIYVIQKHNASHLHYDLRLEMDGILKSWAVPKEPPKEKGVKRLAVATEDHPIGYENFEGTIPEGEYGAGTVEIWDKGSYELESRKRDKIVFHIKGNKMKGRYVLLKFKNQEKNWLFFKVGN
jgi:DNA ligase D-like protein (predicted 3'-phosphoesterase)